VQVAPLGLLPDLLHRAGKAGVLCALGRESLAKPQAVPVLDAESGAPDPRLCWAYAHLWSQLLQPSVPSSSPSSLSPLEAQQEESPQGGQMPLPPVSNATAILTTTAGASSGTGTSLNDPSSASSIMERGQTATMKLQTEHRKERSRSTQGDGEVVVVGAVMGFLVSEALRLVQTLELDQGQTLESGELMSEQALNHDFLLNLTTLLEVGQSFLVRRKRQKKYVIKVNSSR